MRLSELHQHGRIWMGRVPFTRPSMNRGDIIQSTRRDIDLGSVNRNISKCHAVRQVTTTAPRNRIVCERKRTYSNWDRYRYNAVGGTSIPRTLIAGRDEWTN
jgi:hypothetical protein